MFNLINKKVLVTGAGSGIGKEIAILFAEYGAEVIILEMDETKAQEVVDEIVENGNRASYLIADVSKEESVKEAFQTIKSLDILVNNAGIAHIGKIEDTEVEDMERVFSVNVIGFFNCIKAAIKLMKPNKSGTILNMASVAGLVGIPDRFAYSTSKGAVLAMTMSIAKDYINDGIRCNSISPARVHTPFVDGYLDRMYADNREEMFAKLSQSQPIGRMAKPHEIASLALYLCSDEASFVTGCDYPIDGGFVKLNN
ncbi:MAG: SDR family oxidoreductase [Bacteroidota bacterium]